MEKLGRYVLEKEIARGGMGEIYLAEDPVCERKVALKKIRQHLIGKGSIQDRFLREAKCASGLSHPSIIPIYSIHQDEKDIYYTMPYIEGQTLREIINETKASEAPHPIGSSIPALARIFLSICQAMDYAHTKGILHRDLKPENVIVGRFGEVLIIDWGLAIRIGQKELEVDVQTANDPDLTRPGKVVGTVSFMAPERAFNYPSSVATDIYSLGVTFYQLLTLRLPFLRKSLADFRKRAAAEVLVDPQEKAPYRDIPRQLSHIVEKCLAFHPESRYRTVHDIIADLEGYIEGCPDWNLSTTLHLEEVRDWEFQENVLLAKHIAITRMTEVMEWVMLMFSKKAFAGNMRLEGELTLGEECEGVGFLISVPDPDERKGLEDGYCLWVGKEHCTLFRSNVEVLDVPNVSLRVALPYRFAIEMHDNHLKFFIDGKLKLDYSSHLPLVGGHVGLLYRDADFILPSLKVLVGSQNVMVNCLSIPDAFFQSKDFPKALEEYRRISNSFQGRVEGREALFRAGMTLLEWSKVESLRRDSLLDEALEEFEKLSSTSGAPLEYLGKSLVYKTLGDIVEEIKCLEFALRRFAKHPLLHMLEQHVIFRLHETAKKDRTGAYHYALLALRHLPHRLTQRDTARLMEELVRHFEPLPFIKPSSDPYNTMIQLAFWLAKPLTLYEILNIIPSDNPDYKRLTENALSALHFLGCQDLVHRIEQELHIKTPSRPHVHPLWQLLEEGKLDEAKAAFDKYSVEELAKPSLLHLLYGCYLYVTEGKEIAMAHFSTVMDTPYPPIHTLLAHYLHGNIDLKTGWIHYAFLWEKVQLYKQLLLFYRLTGKKRSLPQIEKLIEEELSRARDLTRTL